MSNIKKMEPLFFSNHVARENIIKLDNSREIYLVMSKSVDTT